MHNFLRWLLIGTQMYCDTHSSLDSPQHGPQHPGTSEHDCSLEQRLRPGQRGRPHRLLGIQHQRGHGNGGDFQLAPADLIPPIHGPERHVDDNACWGRVE